MNQKFDISELTMTIFEFDNYKSFIKAKIAGNKTERAYQSKLAEAIGCQKSFFSQVLGGEPHLTPDHAAKLCRFWEFTTEESNYFLNLVLLNRAGSPELRSLLASQMRELKNRRQNLTEKIRWPTISERPGDDLYYTSWYWGAIHMLVSVPKYQTAESIARRLLLPVDTVEAALKWLSERGLIKKGKSGFEVARNLTYLPNTSPMIEMHHFNWRQRALGNIQRQDTSALHYSAAFALSVDDFNEIKEVIVNFIERLNQKIEPSPCEDVACFNCDLFKV